MIDLRDVLAMKYLKHILKKRLLVPSCWCWDETLESRDWCLQLQVQVHPCKCKMDMAPLWAKTDGV